MADPSRIRRQLGAELGTLRTLAGLTQRDLVKALPSSQAAVSRFEHGEAIPTRAQVTTWLTTCAASVEVRDRVLALTRAAHSETRSWRDMDSGAGHLQGTAAERDAAASLVRNCSLGWLPGLVQTAGYARVVLALTDPGGERDTTAAAAARVERQQILYQDGRRFEFLISESALRWAPERSVMGAQLDRLLSLATLPTVEIAVLPVDREGVPAWHSFILHRPADGSPDYVTTELVHGGQEVAEPDAVASYAVLWGQLWKAALHGDEAMTMIRKNS